MKHLTVPQTKDILANPHDDGVCHRVVRADQKEFPMVRAGTI